MKEPTDEEVIQSLAKELMDIQAYAMKKNFVIKSVSVGNDPYDLMQSLTPTPEKIVGIRIEI